MSNPTYTMPGILAGRWITPAARQHAAGAVANHDNLPIWNKTARGALTMSHAGRTFALVRKVGNSWEARVTGWEWAIEPQRGRTEGYSPIEMFWSSEAACSACNRVVIASGRGGA